MPLCTGVEIPIDGPDAFVVECALAFILGTLHLQEHQVPAVFIGLIVPVSGDPALVRVVRQETLPIPFPHVGLMKIEAAHLLLAKVVRRVVNEESLICSVLPLHCSRVDPRLTNSHKVHAVPLKCVDNRARLTVGKLLPPTKLAVAVITPCHPVEIENECIQRN